MQGREQLAQQRVLVVAAIVDEVAGGDDHVGAGRERRDRGHAGLEHGRSVHHAISAAASGLDVQIGNLADEHGLFTSSTVARPGSRLSPRFIAL